MLGPDDLYGSRGILGNFSGFPVDGTKVLRIDQRRWDLEFIQRAGIVDEQYHAEIYTKRSR
jgi:hypothetical protein